MPDQSQPTAPLIPLIDPTLNVKELVQLHEAHRAALRAADQRYQDAMREAETRRVNDLHRQRAAFDRWKDELLRHQVLDLAMISNDRFSKLEQFRYESSGKGAGVTAVVGYIFAFVTVTVAVAVALIKSGHL